MLQNGEPRLNKSLRRDTCSAVRVRRGGVPRGSRSGPGGCGEAVGTGPGFAPTSPGLFPPRKTALELSRRSALPRLEPAPLLETFFFFLSFFFPLFLPSFFFLFFFPFFFFSPFSSSLLLFFLILFFHPPALSLSDEARLSRPPRSASSAAPSAAPASSTAQGKVSFDLGVRAALPRALAPLPGGRRAPPGQPRYLAAAPLLSPSPWLGLRGSRPWWLGPCGRGRGTWMADATVGSSPPALGSVPGIWRLGWILYRGRWRWVFFPPSA